MKSLYIFTSKQTIRCWLNPCEKLILQAFIGRIVDERYNALAWKQNDDWSYE